MTCYTYQKGEIKMSNSIPSFSTWEIIERKDAPRKIIRVHSQKRIHKVKAVYVFDEKKNMYICLNCSVYIKPNNRDKHGKL